VVWPTQKMDVRDVRSLFIVCTAPERFTGIPFCQELIDAASSVDASAEAASARTPERFTCPTEDVSLSVAGVKAQCVTGGPVQTFTVPEKFKAKAMLVRGIICENGLPYFDPSDPELFGCDNSTGEAVGVYGTVPISYGPEDINHNPDMSQLALTLDGSDWPQITNVELPPDDACAGMNVPGIPEISIKTLQERGATEFDWFVNYPVDAVEQTADGAPETLELSFYVTAGVPSARYVLFDPDDVSAAKSARNLKHALTWEPPAAEDIDKNGTLVHVYAAALDRRGGFDMAQRAFCVTR
jgi:hypothetical protein